MILAAGLWLAVVLLKCNNLANMNMSFDNHQGLRYKA
nr:MAG TPA: hypothetical protein [Caudoviricetes sp.]